MLSNKKLVMTCAIITCCNLTLLVLFVKYNVGDRCYVTIDQEQSVTVVLPDDFLSFGIDASEVAGHKKIDFTTPRLRDLAKMLSPARLRLGGTMSERLIFTKDDSCWTCENCSRNAPHRWVCTALCKDNFLPYFIMTGSRWSEINDFCKAANIQLLFTFNVLLRNDHGGWMEQNAKDILDYSKEKGYLIDWQLGNEPNSFPHVFNVTITPQMLAHDFKKLRKLLNHSGYKNSLLVGPDTTRPQPNRPECLRYMQEFLVNASSSINVRSWHQYYLNSRTATLEDFWNPSTFDLLRQQIVTMKNHTKKFHRIPMWLTETSTSYGGGAPQLSNSYAGSPLWIDKLGLSAKHGITTVIRQSFIGGNYSMVDENLKPLPDWWLSVLYKKLVGNKVLHVYCKCSRYQRLYAHCTNRNHSSDVTAITIYGINLAMSKAKFLLNGTALRGENLSIDEYIVSAPSNNRKTKKILLNGWPLHYAAGLGDLKPIHIKGDHISMPPYSIGFWVIKNTKLTVCI